MVFFILRGVFRGFFSEIGSLAGVILGIWFANAYQPQMTDYLKAFLPSVKFLPFVSFAAIFAIVFISCSLVGWGLKIISKKAFLGWADRVLGAVLASVKGVIIIFFVIILLTFFIPSKTPLIAKSNLAPFIISSYQSMVSLISPGFYQDLRNKFHGQKKKIDSIISKKAEDITGKDGFR